MPLTLNVGLTKKHGLPDYGSVGASCHVAVELESSLLHSDLDALHRHIKNAYVACSQAVNDELKRQLANDIHEVTETTVSNGRSNNGSDTNSHRASSKQREYLNQLARQIDGLGIRRLDFVANTICGKPVAELSSLDASSLIDTLKEVKAGHISLDAVFQGTAT